MQTDDNECWRRVTPSCINGKLFVLWSFIESLNDVEVGSLL